MGVIQMKDKAEAGNPNPPAADKVLYLDEGDAAAGASPLVAALTLAAKERGDTLADLAAALEVTYGYFSQLKSGSRKTENISDEVISRCAKYLSVPRLMVYMLAGKVTLEDFYQFEAMHPTELKRAYDFLRADPFWGPLAPKLTQDELLQSYKLVLLTIRLYEDTRGVSVLPGVGDAAEFAKQLDAYRNTFRIGSQKEPKKTLSLTWALRPGFFGRYLIRWGICTSPESSPG
jgi:transcriptional regulator with XRE-family HTH domain